MGGAFERGCRVHLELFIIPSFKESQQRSNTKRMLKPSIEIKSLPSCCRQTPGHRDKELDSLWHSQIATRPEPQHTWENSVPGWRRWVSRVGFPPKRVMAPNCQRQASGKGASDFPQGIVTGSEPCRFKYQSVSARRCALDFHRE